MHRTVAREWIPRVYGQPLAPLNSTLEVMGKGYLFEFSPSQFHISPTNDRHINKLMFKR